MSPESPDTRAGGLLGSLRVVGRLFGRLSRIWGVLLAAGWTGVIWSLSGMHGKPSTGHFVGSWLMNTGHAPLHGLLAFLALISFPRRKAWPLFGPLAVGLTLAGVLLHGILDEWHQASVVGRDSSGFDVLTDMVGASITLWIAAYLGRESATRRGLLRRIALGLLLCLLAGLLGTWP